MSSVKYVSHTDAAIMQIRNQMGRNLRDATIVLYRAVVKKVSGGGRGKEYRIPGTAGKMYRASAAKDPPAVRTGALKNSIRYFVELTRGVVGTDLEYAEWLERGTSTMEPRPYMEPSAEEAQPEIVAIMRRKL